MLVGCDTVPAKFKTSVGVGETPRNHMLIGGTGRAGTSFLVQYLAKLGLETEINRSGHSHWNEQAQAGLETLPIMTLDENLPYVIKTPWLSEFINQILAQRDFKLDVVIVPVRDPVEAAASRVILERRAIYESVPGMLNFDKAWESWGTTAGGMVYSLNPLDQARILAVQFHQLVRQLVEADVPTVFLAFPRLVEDWDYLFKKLRNFLPPDVTPEMARETHRTVADARKVRVGYEVASKTSSSMFSSGIVMGAIKHLDDDSLDRIAMKRELIRLTQKCDSCHSELEARRRERDALRTERDALRTERDALRTERDALRTERDTLRTERDTLRTERDTLRTECNGLITSRSWRYTAPLQILRRLTPTRRKRD